MPGELQVRGSTTVGYLEGNKKTWAFPFFLLYFGLRYQIWLLFFSKDFYIIHEADAIPKFFGEKKIK